MNEILLEEFLKNYIISRRRSATDKIQFKPVAILTSIKD